MAYHRVPPKPSYFDTVPEGTCRWCNIVIGLTPKGKVSKSRWHKLCLADYKLLFWPSATRRAVWKRDNGKCASCGTMCTKSGLTKWHMDHITPLIEANGNLDFWRMANLQTLCVQCHNIKTSKEATARAVKRKMLKDQTLK